MSRRPNFCASSSDDITGYLKKHIEISLNSVRNMVHTRADDAIGSGIAIGLLMIGFGAAQDELWMVGVGVGIQGAGSGVARPPIIAALTEAIGDRDVGVGTGMLNMTGQLGAAAGISILSALVDDGSSADRFLTVLAIAAAIEILAVAMVGAIRFRGPITTRTTPASPTAPYSAVVDLSRGRE